MSDREKALEAALRECRTDLMIAAGNADDAARTDPRWDGVGEKLRVRVREADAALAMPAPAREGWEAGRDVQHIVDAVWAEYADSVKDRWTFRKEHIENAIKRAIAIRNLTPPKDAP